MATYTNLNIPRIADAALQAFVKSMTPIGRFSTSFSADPVNDRQRGNVVLVPLIGTLTATTFSAYNVCGGTQTVITVTVNKHKHVPVGQKDLDALNNSNSSLDQFGAQMGAALAQLVIEDIFTLLTTANYTSATAVASTALDVPQLRTARLLLNQANAPKTGRVCILDCVPYDALLAVTNFVQAQMFKDQSVLSEGRVMRALGMDFFELNNSFGSVNSVMGLVAAPSAIAIAMRYLEPQQPAQYDNTGAFSDPKTGATFGLRDVFDPLSGTRYMALECNYGYSAGITNAARLIKRTD